MRCLSVLVIVFGLAAACGGGSSPTAPTEPGESAQGSTTTSQPAGPTCAAFGGRNVTVGHTYASGLFTHAPFEASDLSLITNCEETNDRRFSYQWIRDGRQASLFAPADGVLVRIRHKAENLPDFPSDDYDLFFLVACDPDNPVQGDTLVRFNHVTDPRPDIRVPTRPDRSPSRALTRVRNTRSARFQQQTSRFKPESFWAQRPARHSPTTSTS